MKIGGLFLYEELVQAAQNNKPLEVDTNWVGVEVPDLKIGEFYVAPMMFWAKELRSLTVQILDPANNGDVLKQWSFYIGQSTTDWTIKRYKLDSSRHSGTGYFRIGSDEKDVAGFTICAAPLTSKKIRHKKAIDQGVCPECGAKGEWISLALSCPEHGVFL